MNRPNIILLTIDTLRADRLGSYGNNRLITPNLDSLAAKGIRFNQAITGGSWTQAAFPVLMTSSYASMYGGCFGRLAPERPSPVEALAAQGYTTAGFSSNPHLSKVTGYDRGFTHFTDLLPQGSDPVLRRIKGGQRLLRNPFPHYVSSLLGKRMRPARVYTSAVDMVDLFSRWLEKTQGPFFAWAHFMDIHWPYHLDEDLVHPKAIAKMWQDVAIMSKRSSFDRKYELTAEMSAHFLDLYERALHYLDNQIGRMFQALANLGLDENTIIVVISDHGEEFLDHGRWGHWESNLFDEIIRVPLIFRLPGWKNGIVIDRLVRLLDLMPTILDLCECSPAEGMEGTSMVPLWRQNGARYDVSESITEMQRAGWHRVAVRTEDFKYIWDNKRPDQPELFELGTDPGEKSNVVEMYPQEARHFRDRVECFLQDVANKQPAVSQPKLHLDAEVIRRLQGLGYMD